MQPTSQPRASSPTQSPTQSPVQSRAAAPDSRPAATGRLCSMTGFAREIGTLPDGTAFQWEMRSVNGRGLDLRLRLPSGLEALEAPLREAAARRLKRGNVSASLSLKREEKPRLAPDPVALEQALSLALALAARIPGCPPPRAEALLTMPGVMRAEAAEPPPEAAEARDVQLLHSFTQALDGLASMRRVEGQQLAAILSGLLDEIAALHQEASAEAAEQPAAQRARLQESLASLLEGQNRLSEERLAQEVALLAQKSDVREELDRLAAHISAARGLLAEGVAIGRKLDFLTQEFGREANTLCSKSASLALTRTGLSLKAAIERLKEQAANVE